MRSKRFEVADSSLLTAGPSARFTTTVEELRRENTFEMLIFSVDVVGCFNNFSFVCIADRESWTVYKPKTKDKANGEGENSILFYVPLVHVRIEHNIRTVN